MCMIHAYVAVGFPVPSFEFLFERKEQNRPLTIRHKTRREFANQCLYGLHVPHPSKPTQIADHINLDPASIALNVDRVPIGVFPDVGEEFTI